MTCSILARWGDLIVFRGLTRREHAIGVGLLVLLAGGVGVRQWMDQPRYDSPLISNAISHPDGQLQIDQPMAPAALTGSVVDGRIDVNVADVALLQELPGIGPVKAASIVAWREENGRFATVDDLDRVPGIGEKTVERLRPAVMVSDAPGPAPAADVMGAAMMQSNPWGMVAGAVTSSSAGAGPGAAAPQRVVSGPQPVTAERAVRINVASEVELQALTGIGPALSRRIVEDRARRGPFRSVDDLQRVSGIGPVIVEKNRHRIVLN